MTLKDEVVEALMTTNGHKVLVDRGDFQTAVQLGNWMAIKKGSVWYACRNKYVAYNNGRRILRRVYLHRFLLGLTDSKTHVDHLNGNGLDNRRANLRACSCVENFRNRGPQANNKSGAKGVWWHKQRGKWAASIRHQRKTISLGLFNTVEAASAAYQKKAAEMWDASKIPRAMIAEGEK